MISGFAKVDIFPVFDPSASAFKTLRIILPLLVFGNSGVKIICFGFAIAPI